MTETSSLYTTHSLPTIPSVTAHPPKVSSLPNGGQSDSNAVEEEEYTIKCICIYADDDGNTVYCDRCDTWQHIECYYHGKQVPEVHFCADCQPRELDGKRATERQRRTREHLEGGDRKVKRPSTKTSKKKQPKELTTHEQTNGWTHHERHDSMSGSRDQPPPAKKPKTSHRTSGSVASLNGESRKRAHSNVQSYPSPSKSPQDLYRFPFIPQYTTDFLELYDRDEGNTNAEGNEYTISALNHLSRWKADRSLLVDGIDQQPNNKSPFVYTQQDIQPSSLPQVTLETIQNTDVEIDGRHPTWRFLRLQQPSKKDAVIGEIRGEVGMLEEYCQQQSSPNRWPELQHPDPFVFFHPHMNIYIDSRKKGTEFRYLRRSCQPNVTLKTFVTDEGDARHCFVASKDIHAGSELTAAWFINPAMFEPNADREVSEQMDGQRCDWISRVLANFGNCACGGSSQCPWTRLDRRSSVRSVDAVGKSGAGRKKKVKSKQAMSPTSTGQATNSRAGSEAVKGIDEDDQDDRRSTSDSSRSGPHSRDLTPVNVAVLDADPVLGSGLTAREMRKIQAAERAFEKSQQRANEERKKKKRTSGGSSTNTPVPGSSKHIGHSPVQLDHQHFLGSPPPRSQKDHHFNSVSHSMATSPTLPPKVSRGTQTDSDPFEAEMRPAKRICYVTPRQRLLDKIKAERDRHRRRSSGTPQAPMVATYQPSTTSDVEMKDAGSGMSPITSRHSQSMSPTALNVPDPIVSVSGPLPSQAAHTQINFKHPSAPRLHLSTLPPVPVFTNGNPTTPGGLLLTPSLCTPTAQSPSIVGLNPALSGLNASIVTPSPVKKKMSLGDYMSRRNLGNTPSTEKTQAQAWAESDKEADGHRTSSNAGSDAQSEHASMRPSSALVEEVAKRGPLEGSAIDDTPIKDETDVEAPLPETALDAPGSLKSAGVNQVSPDTAVEPRMDVDGETSSLHPQPVLTKI